MALVYTPEPQLGSKCPGFNLPGVDGKTWSSEEIPAGTPFLVMFICNHCPYVQAIEDRLISLAHQLRESSVPIFAICSNDADEYPEDNFENLRKRAQEKNYPFPYLVDESQAVARSFGAVCTPDFFLYDKHHALAYRGRLDDSWRDAGRVRKQELLESVKALLEGKPAPAEQVPSMGCSIKWKATT